MRNRVEKTERINFDKEQRKNILDKTGCKCGHCGKVLTTSTMTVDHVFPIDKGGDNSEFNLVALCEDCNKSKSNWIYDVKEYYKYILPMYLEGYYLYNKLKVKEFRPDVLIGYDSVSYGIISDNNKMIIDNMIRRGAPAKKIKDVAKRLSSHLLLEKAYTGDAEEIYKLVDYCKRNNMYFNTDLYDNEYVILNDIKNGEVYVLRSVDKICGAFIFRKLTDENELNIPQLNNIEDCSRLKKKYIMTLACLNKFALELVPTIMQDLYNKMLKNNTIPVYFNILTNLYVNKKDVVLMPYTIDGINGKLEFMTLKHIKQNYIEELKATIEDYKSDCTEDELIEYTDLMFKDGELTEEEKSRSEDIMLKIINNDKSFEEFIKIRRKVMENEECN